jgi:hypothetical protein
MGNLADHHRIGGEGVQIGDCYVWAEIYYLDSTSDYREYLPQNGANGPRSVSLDDLVLLEPSERSPWGLMVFVFALLISGLVSYWVFEVLQAAAVRINTVTG